MMFASTLWILNQGLIMLVMLFIVRQLRQPYRFPQWSWAWGYLLVGMGLTFARRMMWMWETHWLWDTPSLSQTMFWNELLALPVSSALALGFWYLAQIFQQQLTFEPQQPARIVIDQASTVVAWDAAAAVLFGWTQAEMLGQQLDEKIIPLRDRAAHREGVSRYLQSADPGRVFERRFATNGLHKDGREMPVEIVVTAVTDSAGAVQFHGAVRKLLPL